MKRRKTYNKYDKSREEARKALAVTASLMSMVEPYGRF